ncbi:MAG: class II fructose-bisphosphate aldolase [Pseudomonadota bacterium]
MSRATLAEVLAPALTNGYAVPGYVVLGWEDARTYVEAAEEAGLPLILQAGPGFRRHIPLPVIAAMFTQLADEASVPVVVHLDHSTELAECRQALDLGFSSIMFDGSSKSLVQNIDLTAQAVELTHKSGASCEGEIGFVGYAEGEPGSVTDPKEAKRFAAETGVDALAVSVGNVHLQTQKEAVIDMAALTAIDAQTSLPLVLHGGSGIAVDTRQKLARETSVCKFNIGTELRMAFGRALRETLVRNPAVFDRLTIMNGAMPAVKAEAVRIMSELANPEVNANEGHSR